MARSLAGCAGGQSVATPPCAVLHFVARRRLPAVKRTAPPSGRVSLQGQDRATCCIAHPFGAYAANPAASHLIPAPFRRSHTAKANPLRGIARQGPRSQRYACIGIKRLCSSLRSIVTPPGRGKSQAIEHNRALPKVGRGPLPLRSLPSLPLRALRVRVMVGYVLRPSPDKGYFGVAIAALGSSGAARG